MIWVALAWLVALGCVVPVVRRARALSRYELPKAEGLLRRSDGRAAEADAARAALGELDEHTLEVDDATRVDPQLSAALGRVTLASGTACALLCLLQNMSLRQLPLACAAFGAGVVGSALIGHFGLLAKRSSKRSREQFRAFQEEVRRVWLGSEAPLERGRRRPSKL